MSEEDNSRESLDQEIERLSKRNQELEQQIAELTGTREKLNKSEDMLLEIQHLAQFGTWEWDIVNNETLWSDELYRIFGVEPDNFDPNAYESFLNCLYDEDRDFVAGVMDKAMGRRKPFSIEYRIVRPDGTIRYISARGKVLFDDQNKPLKMLGTSQDVTELKQTEEVLMESEEKFRLLFEDSHDLIALTDSFGEPILVNNAWKAVFGEDLDKYKNALDLIHPDDIDKVSKAWKALVSKGKRIKNMVYRYNVPEDKYMTFETSANRMILSGEAFYYTIAHDITERERAEEEMREAANRWQTTFNAINDSVCLIDNDDKVKMCNKPTEELLGKTESELVGGTCWELVHGTTEPIEGCPILEMRKTLKRESMELEREGRIYNVTADPVFDDNKNLIGAVHIISDITDRKVGEEKLKEERNRAELYLDIFGHDINNLNHSILLSSELLLMDTELNEKSRKYVQTSLEQAKSISNLILNVRTLSNLKETELESKNIEYSEMITASIDRVKNSYMNRPITVDQPDSGEKIIVKGNELLADVFDNILGNAVKYDKHEQVSIEILNGLSEDEKFWKIEFKDNGPGIQDELKEEIFKRSQRGKESVHGSGLGLTIVYEVVSRCGGKVWVEDKVKGEPDKGSNFVVMLPRGD